MAKAAQSVQALRNLNPDAYSRFWVTKELLKKNFGSRKISVLDVGGGSPHFLEILTEDKLHYNLAVIDLLPPPEKIRGFTYVTGDATKMKYKPNSFDVVVSQDVLEHVPDSRKVAFIKECYRVAKDLVIIAGPFESPEVTAAETYANNFFRAHHNRDHPWLIEHFEQNKPTTELMAKLIKEFGCRSISFSSNYLPTWLRMILANFMPPSLINNEQLAALNHFYNINLGPLGDFTAPGYRQFYVLYKNDALSKEFTKYFKPKVSVAKQLTLEQKLTTLFATALGSKEALFHHQARQLSEAAVTDQDLRTQLDDTARHAGNLQAMIDDIHSSKAYKFAHGLGSLKRIIKK